MQVEHGAAGAATTYEGVQHREMYIGAHVEHDEKAEQRENPHVRPHNGAQTGAQHVGAQQLLIGAQQRWRQRASALPVNITDPRTASNENIKNFLITHSAFQKWTPATFSTWRNLLIARKW